MNDESLRVVNASAEQAIPISCKQFWSGFDDFYAMSSRLELRTDVRLLTGAGRSVNGVGTEIELMFDGAFTRERLSQKDDINKIFVIEITEPNQVFNYYRNTTNCWSQNGKSYAQMSLDCIYVNSDVEEKYSTFVKTVLPQRIEEVCLFVLERDGLRNTFEVELNYPIEKFWNILIDWNNISWVKEGTKVETLESRYGKNNRHVSMQGNNFVEELLWNIDPEKKEFSYYVYNSTLPVKMYKGVIKLVPSASTFKMLYEQIFLPIEENKGVEIQNAFKNNFEKNNIPWMKEKFRL